MGYKISSVTHAGIDKVKGAAITLKVRAINYFNSKRFADMKFWMPF